VSGSIRGGTVKVRVKEDCTVAVGPDGANHTFKAGQHEVTDENRAALEQLEQMGFAEPVKSTTKEE
jgi:photosystem II stability/assembly factor-like uncharacterized protein